MVCALLVQSGISDKGQLTQGADDPDTKLRYDYAKRRQAIRETWFPSNQEELDRWALGIVANQQIALMIF